MSQDVSATNNTSGREAAELSAEQHYAQFDPSYDGEPPMWTPEELAAANAELVRRIKEPIDWTKGLDA